MHLAAFVFPQSALPFASCSIGNKFFNVRATRCVHGTSLIHKSNRAPSMARFRLRSYSPRSVRCRLRYSPRQKLQSTGSASHACPQERFERTCSAHMNAERINLLEMNGGGIFCFTHIEIARNVATLVSVHNECTQLVITI